ncbi:hypothetical protein [Evansella tamaricis]|uniref:Endolytic transglycosylase MltG n=1 Tax=Evansella tamaricis TaxID=2069301 RepID=A0ABS6JF15_9BACI|nr:hypothetical protein [Evansella tamaricis]MBU9712262.1 hypothetical protein [Evansella tamaricis]
MSIKHNFRGAAIGIFLTTSIFALNYYFGGSNSTSSAENLEITSIEQAISFLEDESFVVLEQRDFQKLTRDLEELEDQISLLTLDLETDIETQQEVDLEEDDTTESAEEDDVEESPVQTYQTVLKIESGMNSHDIAAQLVNGNILEEGRPLIDYIVDNEVDRIIRMGEYNITSEMTIPEIVTIITSP